MPTIRGLELLETIDLHGPLTVSEIAQITGHDKSWVSRIVTACEPDGWVVREGGRIALGPRAALLAHNSSAAELIRVAQPLVVAITGVTGLVAQAYALSGAHATVIAAAGADSRLGVGMSTPLAGTAAGQAIAAQLSPAELERLLPEEPFPDPLADLLANPGYVAFASGRFASATAIGAPPQRMPRSRAELSRVLDRVRAQGHALDRGDLHPQIGCIAVPWTGAGSPAALSCVGAPAEIAAAQELALAALRAAAAPGATRSDIVAAAAATPQYSVAPYPPPDPSAEPDSPDRG